MKKRNLGDERATKKKGQDTRIYINIYNMLNVEIDFKSWARERVTGSEREGA